MVDKGRLQNPLYPPIFSHIQLTGKPPEKGTQLEIHFRTLNAETWHCIFQLYFQSCQVLVVDLQMVHQQTILHLKHLIYYFVTL